MYYKARGLNYSFVLFIKIFVICIAFFPWCDNFALPNSKFPLEIENYIGNYENIHPKVLYFEDGWNEYEFWMAYTPYPLGDINTENPCLAVSHDGIKWETPPGVINPLNPTPSNGYNSDTHLVYDKENNMMEIWWRPFDNDLADCVCRMKSKNGIEWSEPEQVVDYWQFGELILSPAVWIENGLYKLIYSNGKVLKYIYADSSAEKLEWSEPKTIEIDWGNFRAWHQDVIQDEEGNYEMVVCAFDKVAGNNNNSADLFYVKTDHNFENATKPELILQRGTNLQDIDHRSIYRSSLVKVNGLYYLYYSCIDRDSHRHMALSKGISPFELTGSNLDPLEDNQLKYDHLIINEIMPDNVDCLADENNEFSPSWIEIYNPTADFISLNGYKIRNRKNHFLAYKLPDNIILRSKEHLIIYPDQTGTKLHTNFLLEDEERTIYLFLGDKLVDQVQYPSDLPSNCSYGRINDGNDKWGIQLKPTPNEKNDGGITDIILGDPVFNLKGGIYHDYVSLELSLPESAPEGTGIFYTTDGSEPDNNSLLYQSPITVDKNCIVKARLIHNKAVSPLAVTQSFIFHPLDMTLPVLSITSDNKYFKEKSIGQNFEINNNGILFPDFYEKITVPVNIEYFEIYADSAVINSRARILSSNRTANGNLSESFILKSGSNFRSEGFDHAFFYESKPSVKNYNSLEIISCGKDAPSTQLRNALVKSVMYYKTSLDLQDVTPVVLYFNGDYQGLTYMMEPTDNDYFIANYGAGDETVLIDNWNNAISGTIDNFKTFENFYSDPHILKEYITRMDLDGFLDYLLMCVYFANTDSPFKTSMPWLLNENDNRWKWFVKDFQNCLGRENTDENFDFFDWLKENGRNNSLNYIPGETILTLIYNLLGNNLISDLFLDKALVYMGDILRTDKVLEHLEILSQKLNEEWNLHIDNFSGKHYYPDYVYSEIEDFLIKRHDLVYNHLKEYFKTGRPVSMEILIPEETEGSLKFNNMTLSENYFNGKYFEGKDISLVLSKPLPENKEWQILIENLDDSIEILNIADSNLKFSMPLAKKVTITLTDESGIETITDQNERNSWKYYDLNGFEIRKENLSKGFYIRRQGNFSEKIIIK